MKYKELSEDVIDKIKNLFDNSTYKNPKFEFRTDKDGYYIKVSKMYDRPEWRSGSVLQNYVKIAELLGVTDGDEVDHWNSSGCETCDYGSNYGYELKFW